jgi:hypothetical protein
MQYFFLVCIDPQSTSLLYNPSDYGKQEIANLNLFEVPLYFCLIIPNKAIIKQNMKN